MIIESGRVAAVEAAGVWVETTQKSVCSGCQARQGCGHGIMSQYAKNAHYLWVVYDERQTLLNEGDYIEFGLPDDVIVKSSMIIYMLPLITLLLGAALGNYVEPSDVAAMLGGLFGFLMGALIIKWHAKRVIGNPDYQPQFIGKVGVATCEVQEPTYGR